MCILLQLDKMLLELSLLCATLLFITLYIKCESNQKLLVGFKGRRGLPVLGNALDFFHGSVVDRIIPYLTQLTDEFGDRTKLTIGLNVSAIIASAEDAGKILGSTAHTDKGEEYRYLYEWLGFGLITSSGEKWHFKRKLLMPAFHNKILEDFIPNIQEHAELLMSILKPKNGHNCEIKNEIALANLDIICETAMGRKVNAQLQSASPYIRATTEVSMLIMSRPFKPWLTPEFLWKLSPTGKQVTKYIKIMSGFTNKVLEVKRLEKTLKQNYTICDYSQDDESPSTGTAGTKKKLAFLDLLLQIQEDQPDALTSKEIIDDVATFMFAGHDTSATALKWTILRLGNHPEVQAKAQEEIDRIFKNDNTRQITMDDLKRMEYLELVIKETMRLHPPVPLIARQITTPLELDNGGLMKPGSVAWILIHKLHRNTKYWESPEEFIPERFTLENSRGRHPYAYIPFSAGPRNCIGQKFATIVQKIVLAQILQTFNIRSLHKMKDIQQTWEIMLIPKDGVEVELTLRSP